jgi:formylglycine-generating enzyme required for sulfatase activity
MARNHRRHPFVVLVVLGSLLASVFAGHSQTLVHLSISQEGNPTNGFLLTWEASAGEQYNLLTTPSLEPQAWRALNAVPITTSSNEVKFSDSNDQTARFYKVVKLEAAIQIITNMVWIQPGAFTMGSPSDEQEREPDEGPVTEVTIAKGFWMGKYEVTQAEYLALLGTNPSWFRGELNPVDMVSWNDAVNYCAVLTAKERQAGRLSQAYKYRLPTEAEWEYACRAGTATALHYGTSLLSGMANFYGEMEYDSASGSIYNPNGIDLLATTAVGSFEPNAWGLFDMHGNIREWCMDRKGVYPGGSVADPQGAATGPRVNRGGSWYSDGRYCRSADRFSHSQTDRVNILGFRIVLAQSS